MPHPIPFHAPAGSPQNLGSLEPCCGVWLAPKGRHTQEALQQDSWQALALQPEWLQQLLASQLYWLAALQQQEPQVAEVALGAQVGLCLDKSQTQKTQINWYFTEPVVAEPVPGTVPEGKVCGGLPALQKHVKEKMQQASINTIPKKNTLENMHQSILQKQTCQ